MDYLKWKKRIFISTYAKVIMLGNTEFPIEHGVTVSSTVCNSELFTCLIGNETLIEAAISNGLPKMISLASVGQLTTETAISVLKANSIDINTSLELESYISMIINNSSDIETTVNMLFNTSASSLIADNRLIESNVQLGLHKEIQINSGQMLDMGNTVINIEHGIILQESVGNALNFISNLMLVAVTSVLASIAVPKDMSIINDTVLLLSWQFSIGLNKPLVVSKNISFTIAPHFLVATASDIDAQSNLNTKASVAVAITLSTSAILEYYRSYSLEEMEPHTLQEIVEYL